MAQYLAPDYYGNSAGSVNRVLVSSNSEPKFGEPGYWSWDNIRKRISRGWSTAGQGMRDSVTPLANYVNAETSGGDISSVDASLSSDSGVSEGVTPQGDFSSLDKTGYDQAEWEFQKQLELLAEQRAYNSAEAEKNRQWQERLSNTAYQRAVEDLEKAGLNKWLAVTGGNGASASTPSGSSATSSAGDASAPNPRIYQAMLQLISNLATSAIKLIDFF